MFTLTIVMYVAQYVAELVLYFTLINHLIKFNLTSDFWKILIKFN